MPTAAILNQERERWARKQTATLLASQAFSATESKQINEVGQLAAQTTTESATIFKQTGDVIPAQFGLFGSTSKQSGVGISGIFGFAGSLVRQTGANLSAAFGLAGSLVRQIRSALSATFGLLGATGKQTGIGLSAISSFSGSLARQTGLAFSATSSFAGLVVRQTGSSLRAAFGMSASMARQTGATLSSIFGFAGSVGKQVNRTLAASTSAFNGLLSETLVFVVAIAASMQTFTGVISRQMKANRFASLGFAASASKMTSVAVSASAGFVGSIGRQTSRLVNAITQTLSVIWTAIKSSTPIPPTPAVFKPIVVGTLAASSGLSVSNPAEIDKFSPSLQIFSGLSRPFATADGWSSGGQRVMGGQLLVAPGNGSVPNRMCQVVMGGIATIPVSASGVNLVVTLFQNYFQNGVLAQSDPLSVISVPVVAGESTAWSMICQISGNGHGNGQLRAQSSGAVRWSTFNPIAEPKIQISAGVNLQGSGPDLPQVQMMQFDLQT
jgi:hypothetical protein